MNGVARIVHGSGPVIRLLTDVLLVGFITIFALALPRIAYAAPAAAEILSRADAIRNPDEDFVMKVEIRSAGEVDRVFEVSTKGRDRTVVRTLAPARDKNRDLLMRGEDMWAYIPNLMRAVRVGLSQRLAGEAANGDISRMRWAGDYSAKIESETDQQWVLLLEATKKGLTYEKIRARIDKKTFRPLGAEYLTAAGKSLKKASFDDYRMLAGKERPGSIAIEDTVRADKKSVIRITEMRPAKLSDSLFGLERFQSR